MRQRRAQMLAEIEHQITVAELRTQAQASVIAVLARARADTSEAESALWAAMDALATLRRHKMLLQATRNVPWLKPLRQALTLPYHR